MAHHVEPMDIDSDFDNKENSLHHNNVLPFTEKGYEELDVSELNMKLRYSITPASSPMSKSYTANCLDNRSLELRDDSLNVTVNENSNIMLTRSLNSTMTNKNDSKNDSVLKSLKALPLKALSTEQFVDNNRSTSVIRPLDSTAPDDNANITVTVSGPSDIDENLSLPSTSSSVVQTPEATTPTKDITKNDGGSPIMRGLKSVLNIFRSSQSPIPPSEREDIVKPDLLSPSEESVILEQAKLNAMLASTPIAAHRKKETSPTKRSSPHKDSIVFNEDLEKELQWKDETTIIFSQERMPIHKLFFHQPVNENKTKNKEVATQEVQDDMNSTVEYMDISCNDSIRDRTMTDIQVLGSKADGTFTGESDGEFLDCETTFTKNESLIEDNDKTPVADKIQDLDITKVMDVTNDFNVAKDKDIDVTKDIDLTIDMNMTKDMENVNENTSTSRLKQIILNTTQDILDATLSIKPEDLIPEAGEESKVIPDQVENIDSNVTSGVFEELEKTLESIDTLVSAVSLEDSLISSETIPAQNETVDVIRSLVDVKEEGILNITKTIENEIEPILEQTMEIVNSLINAKVEEDFNATNKIETNQAEIIITDNQFVSEDNLEPTSSSETVIQVDYIEDQVEVQAKHNNVNDLITDSILDMDINKTSFDASRVIDDNAKNSAENSISTISSPEEAIQQPLPISNNYVEASPVKETSMTELAADIPLPDEDDLEKELNVPEELQPDSLQEASSEHISLPLALVNNIIVKSEIPQIIQNEIFKDNELKSEDSEIVLPEVQPLLNTPNLGGGDTQNETAVLKPEVIKVVEEVTEHADINSETPIISEELQIITTDVISETAPSLDIVANKAEDKADQVPDNLDAMNKTETLNATVTGIVEQNVIYSQEVVPMDINESVIELKPLPDIINQTISNPTNMDNHESATNNLEQSAIAEQLAPLSENVVDEVPLPEIVPEAIINTVPELLSDANVSEIPMNEVNVIAEKQPNTQTIEEVKSELFRNVTECSATEDIPLEKEANIDEQPTNVDVIPTQENEKQPLNMDIIPDNEIAEIKTVDEEIILSENNSPFISVIGDDITPEERRDVHNIDDRLAIPGKEVFTPPSSPPITSKGYNFNFDEIDDPFATKTKIRLSPTLETPTKAVELEATSRCDEKPILKKEINNRRKSQPERKKFVAPKRKFNSTFSGTGSEKTAENPVEIFTAGDINLESPPNVALDPNNVMIDEDKLIQEARIVHEKTLKVTKEVLKSEWDNKVEDKIENFEETPIDGFRNVESETSLSKEVKPTSSEQSNYFSAGTSSIESIPSRNVFNIPEIDDMNFNPFTTKPKILQSPPPSLDMENPFATKSKIRSSPDSSIIIPQINHHHKIEVQDKTLSSSEKMESELMEKDASEILSNSSVSSKATDDRNATMREINTEDEDTVEGPFLESEDLHSDDKMLDFDDENNDMMQFNDLPTQGSEDNADNGELFIDAEAFEFLLNQNKSNSVVDSGKESLFLKFDPLFAKRMSAITSEGMAAALSKIQKRQSTPRKATKPLQKEVSSPVAGPSNLNVTQAIDINMSEELNDDLNITVSKPMMVVPPAVNPVSPRNKPVTPNRSNRRSVTFTSPAMAVIDRLLSLSGNSSLVHDTSIPQVTREQNEADLALVQLRELLAEKEVHVYNLRSESKELKDRLTSLESQLKSLEEESQDRLKNINDLNERLAEKTKVNKSMAAVVEEYERTIASLISEIAQDKKRHAEERIKLINERDEQTAHLASMEVSFSDLHSKYEKSKQVILNCKANEDAYKKILKEREENLVKLQNNYELLKQHATSKLNHANQELEKMNRSHEAEVLKLNAMIKRKELHITSLEESLAQKTKANEELTAICDELINKVG